MRLLANDETRVQLCLIVFSSQIFRAHAASANKGALVAEEVQELHGKNSVVLSARHIKSTSPQLIRWSRVSEVSGNHKSSNKL